MRVLSLFDGMSCGRIALDRAGIEVSDYYAAEIDKYAIKVSSANYPESIQLGDVCGVQGSSLGPIDLLIGGSPCQGFSFAGNQLNFKDPRSKLFFEYLRLLQELSPKYFLLENVKMKQQSQDVISKALGVEPVMINSKLVSAQNRNRLYWTNIPYELPEDKGITIKNILDWDRKERPAKKNPRNLKQLKGLDQKGVCLTASCFKGAGSNGMTLVGYADLKGHDYVRRVYSINGKAPTLCASSGGNLEPKIPESAVTWRKLSPLECERLQTVPDGYTDKGVSDTQRYKMLGNGWTVDVISHIFKGMK